MKQQGHIQTHNFREKCPYKCDVICLVRIGYLVDNYFNTSITNMNITTFDLAHPTSINIQKINETTRTTNTILEKNALKRHAFLVIIIIKIRNVRIILLTLQFCNQAC